MTLAGAVATVSVDPTTAPLVGSSGSRTQSTASIPDFSGLWLSGGLGFGRPLSGPGQVGNKTRLPSGASDFRLVVGDYTNPILKPEAAEVVKKFGEISSSGRIFPDPDSLCLQNPVPYIFWNFNVYLLQQPDKVTLVYPPDSDFPVVRLTQPHPPTATPSFHGD